MTVATYLDLVDAHLLTMYAVANSGGGGWLGVHRASRIATADDHASQGYNHGWWKNTTGSAVAVRLYQFFDGNYGSPAAYGGYTCSAYVLVSATAPASLAVAPAASAAAVAGAVQLAIASGASSSATVSVPAGSYLYIVSLSPSYAWAGGSPVSVYLDAAGSGLAALAHFPSAGSTAETWNSPVFVTGGTKAPPATGKWVGNWQGIYVPANYYVYVVQMGFGITWLGSSDQAIRLHDGATGNVATLAYLPSQGSGTFSETWKSPFFLTGGSATKPSARWAAGQVGAFVKPTPSGYYQNGGTARYMYLTDEFAYAGYNMDAALVVDAAAPAAMVEPGAALGSSQSVLL